MGGVELGPSKSLDVWCIAVRGYYTLPYHSYNRGPELSVRQAAMFYPLVQRKQTPISASSYSTPCLSQSTNDRIYMKVEKGVM